MPSCGDLYTEPLFTDINTACANASGFWFTSAIAPTIPQINRICASPYCSRIVAATRKVQVSECTVENGTHSVQLYKEIMDPIAKVCDKGVVVVTGPPSTTDMTNVGISPSPSPNLNVSSGNETQSSTTNETKTTSSPLVSTNTSTTVPSPSPTKSQATKPGLGLLQTTLMVAMVASFIVLQA